MPTFSHVLLEKDNSEHIAWLTINRPQRRNAIDDLTVWELAEAIEDIEADDEIRVAVLTGAGKAFCAGGDLQALAGGKEPGPWTSGNTDDIRRRFKGAQRLMLGLQRIEKPVIAMINGVAVGAGSSTTARSSSAPHSTTRASPNWMASQIPPSWRGSSQRCSANRPASGSSQACQPAKSACSRTSSASAPSTGTSCAGANAPGVRSAATREHAPCPSDGALRSPPLRPSSDGGSAAPRRGARVD